MSLESEYLLDTAIRSQETARSAAAERKLENASDDISARQFAEAMEHAARSIENRRTSTERIRGSGAVAEERAVGVAEGGAGPGDAILNGIKMLRSAYDSRIDALARSVSDVSNSPTEAMYEVQLATADYSIFTDAVSKVAGKFNQTVNELMKSA